MRRSARRLTQVHLRTLLADTDRIAALQRQAAGIEADFSRQRLDAEALDRLIDLALASGFEQRRADLFAGAVVNHTEQRPALHTALRGVGGPPEVAQTVAAQRTQMSQLAAALRKRALRGHSGEPLESLVCIGIGGSDLGPRLVCDALAGGATDAGERGGEFEVRFVANVDPDDLQRALFGLDPARTAFAVVSKTFTTRETLANADAARRWLVQARCPQAALTQHFFGITASAPTARDWGIAPERLLEFRDWVGGRYSLWSSVGFPIAVAFGPETFNRLLEGAAALDRHFLQAPLAENLPALMGMVSVWNRSFLGSPSQAVVPYSERLRLLPSYLQQLVMESNGKAARRNGSAVDLRTAPVIWGASGTNAQHSFFQQLHQGTDPVPVDFILAREPVAHSPADRGRRNGGAHDGGADDTVKSRHQILLANCLAQASALALGQTGAPSDRHRAFPGDRPSTLLVLPRVDPEGLGALLACHEHATFTSAVLLDINPFDQFGVELGKVVARSVEAVLEDPGAADPKDLDPATLALARRLSPRRDNPPR